MSRSHWHFDGVHWDSVTNQPYRSSRGTFTNRYSKIIKSIDLYLGSTPPAIRIYSADREHLLILDSLLKDYFDQNELFDGTVGGLHRDISCWSKSLRTIEPKVINFLKAVKQYSEDYLSESEDTDDLIPEVKQFFRQLNDPSDNRNEFKPASKFITSTFGNSECKGSQDIIKLFNSAKRKKHWDHRDTHIDQQMNDQLFLLLSGDENQNVNQIDYRTKKTPLHTAVEDFGWPTVSILVCYGKYKSDPFRSYDDAIPETPFDLCHEPMSRRTEDSWIELMSKRQQEIYNNLVLLKSKPSRQISTSFSDSITSTEDAILTHLYSHDWDVTIKLMWADDFNKNKAEYDELFELFTTKAFKKTTFEAEKELSGENKLIEVVIENSSGRIVGFHINELVELSNPKTWVLTVNYGYFAPKYRGNMLTSLLMDRFLYSLQSYNFDTPTGKYLFNLSYNSYKCVNEYQHYPKNNSNYVPIEPVARCFHGNNLKFFNTGTNRNIEDKSETFETPDEEKGPNPRLDLYKIFRGNEKHRGVPVFMYATRENFEKMCHAVKQAINIDFKKHVADFSNHLYYLFNKKRSNLNKPSNIQIFPEGNPLFYHGKVTYKLSTKV